MWNFNPNVPRPQGVDIDFDTDGGPIIVIVDPAVIKPGTVAKYAAYAGVNIQWNIGDVKVPIRFQGQKGFSCTYPELIDSQIEKDRQDIARGFCEVPPTYYNCRYAQ